jgi:P4 family phage/plasmid primase-like protien
MNFNNSNINSINDWADFWFYLIGVNVITADTKNKKTYENWLPWQDEPISEEEHELRNKNGEYNKGIAIIPGLIWRGPYKGKYLVAIDLDNKKAIEEFCRDGLEELKQKTLVEQTSNPEKMHIYFIVEREIPNKASDKSNTEILKKINANEIPALEVKSNGKGIMFCANSPHQKDGNYRIIGTLKPEVFPASMVEERISLVCKKYNIPYGFCNNGNNNNNNNNNNYNFNIGPSIQELFTHGTQILEGHNRHLGILRVMDSLLVKNMGFLTLDEIKGHAYKRNLELCVPPLDDRDMERQWKQALNYANRKIREREKAAKQKQEERLKNNNNNKNTASTTTTTNTKTKVEKQDLIEEATRLVMSIHRFLTIEESKEILYYDDESGVYVSRGEILIEKELDKTFGFRLRTSDITEIKNCVMRKTYVKKEKFDSNLDIINLKNGLYNWRTNEFMAHTPDYYSLNQKTFPYNPEARPKLFIKFLRQVLYLEDIRTAVEIIAYSFIRKNLFEHYFVLIGNGANGKSVFIGILSNLHGLKNVSNVSLHSLVNNRFALADLENKDINVDTELSNTSINDTSILKKLTGIQPLRIEQKGKPAYDAIIYAKLFFNANQLPTTSDNSDAHYRREIILQFPRQFEGENEDPNLLNKIIANEEEMSGIFHLVVNSMRTIVNKNKIHVNASTISQRRAKAKLTQNPVKAFLEDALAKEPGKDDYEKSDDMYDAFYRFCQHHQLYVLGFDAFSETLRKEEGLRKDRKKMKDGKKRTIWYCKLVKWKNTGDSSQKTLMNEEIEEQEQRQEEEKESREEKYRREQEEIRKWG